MIAAGVMRSESFSKYPADTIVVGTDHRAARLVVPDPGQPQPGGGIDDGKVGAELVHPVVEQPRHHRRRAVQGVAGLAGPEPGHCNATAFAFGHGHTEGGPGGIHRGKETVRRSVAANLSHLLGKDGVILDPVAITVDDRMLEACTNLAGVR
jgi:hypothetical protein